MDQTELRMMQSPYVEIDGTRFNYRNREEFSRIFDDIFVGQEYKPAVIGAGVKAPKIIDCGAHIGVSIAYFKQVFPEASIVAFEPNPSSYKLLRHNIAQNNWTKVEAINAAVDAQSGENRLIISNDDHDPWTWGDSLVKNDWYSPDTTRSLMVSTVALSNYLIEAVDLLKLDVEGVEAKVIEEIEPRIQLIQEMFIEYHGSQSNPDNNLDRILAILARNSFKISLKQNGIITSRQEINQQLPNWIIIHAWQE